MDAEDMTRKSGTRTMTMMQGAMLAMRHLAIVEGRWPHLREIQLEQEIQSMQSIE